MRYFALSVLFFITACQTSPSVIGNRAPAIQSLQEQSEEPVQQQRPETLEKKDSSVFLDHKYFTILYDKDHRLARWVQYRLTKEDLQLVFGKRKNKFHPDALLKKKGIEPVRKTDIPGKQFDKGHLAPADDFKRSQDAIDQTFVMSNIAPQKPQLNQTAWRRLEVLVQKWACGEDDVTIVTGPILKSGLPRLDSGVSIPDRFFKAVYTKSKSICFIYDQTDDRRVSPYDRDMSVRDCEKEIGFDIGPQNSEDIETKFDFSSWKQANCRAGR